MRSQTFNNGVTTRSLEKTPVLHAKNAATYEDLFQRIPVARLQQIGCPPPKKSKPLSSIIMLVLKTVIKANLFL